MPRLATTNRQHASESRQTVRRANGAVLVVKDGFQADAMAGRSGNRLIGRITACRTTLAANRGSILEIRDGRGTRGDSLHAFAIFVVMFPTARAEVFVSTFRAFELGRSGYLHRVLGCDLPARGELSLLLRLVSAI